MEGMCSMGGAGITIGGQRLSILRKTMVGRSLAWRIDRPKQKRAYRKKEGLLFFLPPDPIISLDLLDSQKSFSYQNMKNFARKTIIKFWKLCVKAHFEKQNNFFFLPTDQLNISVKGKKIWLNKFFFIFNLPTNRLHKNGLAQIRHSKDQPTMA